MTDSKRAALIQYTVCGAIALVLTLLIVWYESSQAGSAAQDWIRFLCDGFFVSGILYLGFGAMLWIAQAGGFHAMSYLFYTVGYMFTANKNRFNKRKNYYEYKMEKAAKETRQEQRLQRRILVVGLACLAAASLFLMLFYA